MSTGSSATSRMAPPCPLASTPATSSSRPLSLTRTDGQSLSEKTGRRTQRQRVRTSRWSTNSSWTLSSLRFSWLLHLTCKISHVCMPYTRMICYMGHWPPMCHSQLNCGVRQGWVADSSRYRRYEYVGIERDIRRGYKLHRLRKVRPESMKIRRSRPRPCCSADLPRRWPLRKTALAPAHLHPLHRRVLSFEPLQPLHPVSSSLAPS